MKSLLLIFPFLVFLFFLWTNYQIISLIVTYIRLPKNHYHFCLTLSGKIVYIVTSICYVLAFIGSIAWMVYYIGIKNDLNYGLWALNFIVILGIAYNYATHRLILVGKKDMFVGRALLDYRKIKRVSFPRDKRLKFTYGQKDYITGLSFIDKTELKKYIIKK